MVNFWPLLCPKMTSWHNVKLDTICIATICIEGELRSTNYMHITFIHAYYIYTCIIYLCTLLNNLSHHWTICIALDTICIAFWTICHTTCGSKLTINLLILLNNLYHIATYWYYNWIFGSEIYPQPIDIIE